VNSKKKILEFPLGENGKIFKNNKIFFHLKKLLRSSWPYHLVRFALALIFIYAGLMKLIDPKVFAEAISQYDLIPEGLITPVAFGLPTVELLAGLGLILNIRGSLTVIFSLLIMFLGALGYGILNHLDIDCGCLTPAEIKGQNSLKYAFYRDLVMIGAVFFLFLSQRIQSHSKGNYIWSKIRSINGGIEDV